ncbi:MAG TPA: TIGR03435 family protein [Acidobacteriaceae bacterium]|nr:TIGR03435 family protein [Acidobacteriaceae bacterium]
MFGFAKVVVPWLVVCPLVVYGQVFDSVTIKPASASRETTMRLQILPNGDLIAHAVPPVMLVSYAYSVPVNPSPLLSSLPDWTIRERYDVEAKAPVDAIPPGLPDSEKQSRMRQMIRRLLADRFGLVMRVEEKAMPVYALTVAGGGSDLQRAATSQEGCLLDSDPQGCHTFVAGVGHPLDAKAIDMDDLALYIENWTDLPVVNRTGLKGEFTVNTPGWLPMRLPPPPPNVTPAANPFAGLPTIFAVLGNLGLELRRQEEVLPVYTVERMERPSADGRQG